MFKQIQYRLLVSYLAVFASILGTFAIAVRIVYAHSLRQQLTNELTTLGQGAVTSAEFDHGRLQVGNDISVQDLIARGQAMQWFDLRGQLIAQQGKTISTLPFSSLETSQIQSSSPRIQLVTLPIVSSNNQHQLGYVRASQSLEELDENLQKLDWGLGSGIVMALMLSGIGGVWLTRQAMSPIEESFQRLKQFTADASHELRNPLMAIKSNVSVALKYPDGMRPIDAEKFAAIASASDQMAHLTEDLLLLARTDKATKPEQQPIDLTEILERLVELYQLQAQTKQITLQTNLAQSAYVFGDVAQLTRLFTNLIVNALHYTLKGGRVEVNLSRTGQSLIVDVTDTGVGIAPEHLARVFDRFWRADQSRAYWKGGSGLGLAIAQSIVQSHRGTITVKSQINVGSYFTVRLPLFAGSTCPK
ncbi:MAG: two-component sensor histidine kinase [Leptolyngbya sp.]|nr:MAG: two-component sensor histidine kinase [Leptolyngbya sp.]